MSTRPQFTEFKRRLLRNPTIRRAYDRSRRVHIAQDAQQHLETWVETGDRAALQQVIETLERA